MIKLSYLPEPVESFPLSEMVEGPNSIHWHSAILAVIHCTERHEPFCLEAVRFVKKCEIPMAFLSPLPSLPCRLSSRFSVRLPTKRLRSLRYLVRGSYTVPALESVNNPRVKAARNLLRRRVRETEGKILLEGHRLVLDAVNASLPLESLFYTKSALTRGSRSAALRDCIASVGSSATMVSDKVMASLSDVSLRKAWWLFLPAQSVR